MSESIKPEQKITDPTGNEVVAQARKKHLIGSKRANVIRGGLSFLTALTFTTVACISQIFPSTYSETSVTQIAQGDDLLLTPSARQTAIIGTVESVQSIGVPELIKNGFPEVAITSQDSLFNNFSGTAIINGVEVQYAKKFKSDSTFVNMDGTPLANYLINVTAGHSFDEEEVKKKILEMLALEYKVQSVELKTFKLEEVSLGSGIILPINNIGITTEFENGVKDYSIMAIPLAKMSEEDAFRIKKNAVPYKDILFSRPPKNGYYGYCKPAMASFRPVVTINASVADWEGNYMKVYPYLVEGGCSGSGIFVNTPDGFKFVGITVAIFKDVPGETKFDYVFPFYKLREKNFMRQAGLAVHSIKSGIQP